MTAPMQSTFVELGGRKIWCGLVGEPTTRPPLLCIPGGPGISYHYLSTLGALAAERQVIFYDPLGAGQSERPEMAWTAELYAEEVTAVTAGLGLDRYHLFVHSAAGFAGLVHAAARPAGLGALILSGTPASIPAHTTHVRGLLVQMGLSAAELAAFERAEREPRYRDVVHLRIVNAFMGRYACNLRPLPPALAQSTANINPVAHRMMKGGWVLYTTALGTWDFTARLGEIAAPTLFTYGSQDILSLESCADIQRRIPDCESHVFEKSTHMPHLEEPDAHRERVARFLASHDQ